MSAPLLTPKISEKAIGLAERGQYVFEVSKATNKVAVAHAVEAAFKVKVTGVNMLVIKGKPKKFKQISGKRHDIKKAIVTLKKGDSIKLFEGAS